MARTWLLLGLVGCGAQDPEDRPGPPDADADADSDSDSDSDADTDTDPGAAISGSCAQQPGNALRAVCDLEVDPAGGLEITFEPTAGGLPRTMAWPDLVAEHQVTLWRMYAETEYTWTATATATGATLTGAFTTGALPAGADVEVQVEVNGPGPTAPDDVLLQLLCDAPVDGSNAVVVDSAGVVVWYQELDVLVPPGDDDQANATVFTTAGDLATTMNRNRVRRFDLDGALLLDVAEGVTPGFDAVVHHDLFLRDGLLYALNAREYRVGDSDYLLDGFFVFDAAGQTVGSWELRDHVTPSGGGGGGFGYWSEAFPGAIDWSHANGIYVDEALDVVLSFAKLNTIVKVRGDATDPSFGEILWVLDGNGSSPWPSDFTITDPLGLTTDLTFAFQHHPSLLPSGNLLMFDNGGDVFATARALELHLDESAGTAAIVGSWPVAPACTTQGSAYELSNGNLLATCASQSTAYEIDRLTGEHVRTIRPTCDGVFGTWFPRGIPVAL